MAKEKNNNGLYICIAVAVVVVIAIVVGVIVANNNKNSGTDGQDNSSQSSKTDGNEVEYFSTDETIDFGDYEAMEILSKSIQNGEATGRIVKINGIVSHPMRTYSIVQENSDGTKKIGTQFIIEGADESSYPKDGEHVVITGEVVETDPMVFVIKTTPNNIEILE